MNFRTTVALIVLLALASTALLIVRYRGSSDENKDKKPATLLGVEAKDVTRLVITPATGARTIFEKSGEDWKMLEPVAAVAEKWTVDGLVRDVTELRSRSELDVTGENAKAIGVDAPRYVVEVVGKDGKSKKLKVGNRASAGGAMYVLVDGEAKPQVVSDSLYEKLSRPLAEFRQTRLVSAQAGDIRQIEITRPGEKPVVLHKEGENWKVVQPEAMPADTAAVSDLTYALTGLYAVGFVKEDEIFAPLRPSASPTLTVWFTTAAPTTQPATTRPAGTTIHFGGPDSVLKANVYVQVSDPPALAKVAATSVDAFKKKPIELRDKNVVDVNPDLVSELSVVTDRAATTQPTTRPASRDELSIQRRKESLVLGPDLPPATQPAATQPSTQPTTQASTQPTTQPSLPATPWVFKKGGEASEARVSELLAKFHPLRADKFLTEKPSAAPLVTYEVRIVTEAAGKTTSHVLRIMDLGEEKPLAAEYNGLFFELPRTLIEAMTGDFANR